MRSDAEEKWLWLAAVIGALVSPSQGNDNRRTHSLVLVISSMKPLRPMGAVLPRRMHFSTSLAP